MKDILGLMVLSWPLVLLVLIVLAMLIAVPLAIWHAKRHGRNKWAWGIGVFMLIFLPVFWDWIPTVVAHKYYCSTEAGFWVYKSVDQWKAENPGVMEELVANKERAPIQTSFGPGAELNERFVYFFRYDGPFLFNRWRIETEIRDRKSGEVIAREVGFSTSQERRQAGWTGWKFWLDNKRCEIEKHRDQGSFYKIMEQFEGAKK